MGYLEDTMSPVLHTSFTFGYDGGTFNAAEKIQGQRLECNFLPCTREPGSFKDECIEVAKLLSQQAASLGRVPTILLSGGLDSEVVVKAFMDAQVPFATKTFRFAKGLNAHEIRNVERFCASNGLKPSYYDMDIESWIVGDEARKLLFESQAWSMSLVPHMKLMNVVWEEGGLPILGNGDLYLENDGSGWSYTELEYMLSWYRHAIKNEILGGIGFFQHTPEIILAMVNEPIMDRLGHNLDTNANRMFSNSRYVKYRVYKRHWPDLVSRQKFHGAELVSELFRKVSTECLTGVTPTFYDRWQVSFEDFKRMLTA